MNQSFRLSLPKDYKQKPLGFLGVGDGCCHGDANKAIRDFMGFEDCARGVTKKKARKSERKSMRKFVVPEQLEVRCDH